MSARRAIRCRRAGDADGYRGADDSADARRRYLARQPEAEMFAGFGDFAFYEIAQGRASCRRLRPHRRSEARRLARRSDRRRGARCRRAGGARAHECRSRRDLPALCDQAAGAPTATGAASAATRKASTCNSGALALRLPFPQRCVQPGLLRAVLKHMAEQARAALPGKAAVPSLPTVDARRASCGQTRRYDQNTLDTGGMSCVDCLLACSR